MAADAETGSCMDAEFGVDGALVAERTGTTEGLRAEIPIACGVDVGVGVGGALELARPDIVTRTVSLNRFRYCEEEDRESPPPVSDMADSGVSAKQGCALELQFKARLEHVERESLGCVSRRLVTRLQLQMALDEPREAGNRELGA